jgi:acyl carrier protein
LTSVEIRIRSTAIGSFSRANNGLDSEEAGMDVHQRLESVFKEVFNDDSLSLRDDMSSRDIPGWDSVAHINLMFAIESNFGIQFVGNELAEYNNVGELKNAIARKTGG